MAEEVTEEEIEEIKSAIDGLKEKISIARKNNVDMTLQSWKVMNLPSKLKYLEAGKERRAFQKLRQTISEIDKEIPSFE